MDKQAIITRIVDNYAATDPSHKRTRVGSFLALVQKVVNDCSSVEELIERVPEISPYLEITKEVLEAQKSISEILRDDNSSHQSR